MVKQLNLLICVLVLLVSSITVESAETDIKEWLVPYENTRPRDPYVDAKGRVWFCGQAGSYLAYLIPQTGEFRKYPLGDGIAPHNLIVDNEGFVWFAANTAPFIGKLNANTGKFDKYIIPGSDSIDPHTLVFDSAGDIWFTAQWSNTIGKLMTKTAKVTLFKVPIARSRPYGIRVDSHDRPWVVLFGTNKLATVDPKTMKLSIIELPSTRARPRRLAITKDNDIWYVDYAGGILGRYTPKNGKFADWPLPGGVNSRPYGVAKDHRENIWIAEGGSPNKLVAFSTTKKDFVSVSDIPKSRGSVRHMYFHKPSREIWFGEDSNYIGRARVP